MIATLLQFQILTSFKVLDKCDYILTLILTGSYHLPDLPFLNAPVDTTPRSSSFPDLPRTTWRLRVAAQAAT